MVCIVLQYGINQATSLVLLDPYQILIRKTIISDQAMSDYDY